MENGTAKKGSNIEPHWIKDLSIHEYHSKTDFLGSGQLRTFIRSPYHYFQSLSGNAPEPTPSMNLGTLIHLMLSEPHRYHENVILKPDFNRRTKQGKLDEAEWVKENIKKIIVDNKQYEILNGIYESLKKLPMAMNILKDGHKEISGFFLDPSTSIQCRIRPDIFIPRDGKIPPIILDIKSTKDASEEAFQMSIKRYGYHIAAAYYLRGASIIEKEECSNFMWIAVENVAPYAVAVYEMDQAWREIGESVVSSSMKKLSECIDKDDWPAYQSEPQMISPPEWLLKKYEHIYEEIA